MRKAYSNPPPESTRLPDSSEKMPDFNNLFQESVPKMMRVTDDLHQMILLQSTNIRDLQNMMIGLLTIIGILIFFILKYRNGKQKQKRRRRSNRGKYRFNGIRSENSFIGNRYMNKNCDAFMSEVHLFDDVLICGECRFRTNDINKFADHKSRKCSNITKAPSEPESIQCFICENTFESSWKLLQHLTNKHNLNLYRDASTTDETQERRGPQPPSPLPSESVKSEQKSREMLCNENSPVLYDSTDAHEMSKDYCIGKIVDEEKETYTYDKKPVSPTTTTSTTSGGFIGLNKKISANTIKIKRGNVKHVKQSNKQTTFNQHTTNFIICSSDSLKPLV
uniref:C2H2-type domain-containing protein n=1 Tax=Panagrolaimus davidi TaxID=227884 RepID=A0A914PQK6_9BILA